jgi:hypothetical protein
MLLNIMAKRAEELFSFAQKVDEGALMTFHVASPHEGDGLVAIIPGNKEGCIEEAIEALSTLRTKWHEEDEGESFPEDLAKEVGGVEEAEEPAPKAPSFVLLEGLQARGAHSLTDIMDRGVVFAVRETDYGRSVKLTEGFRKLLQDLYPKGDPAVLEVPPLEDEPADGADEL